MSCVCVYESFQVIPVIMSSIVVGMCMYVCMYVCVCVGEREKERARGWENVCQ